MNSVNNFNWQRLSRLIYIEIQNYWKRIVMATGMLCVLGLMVYTNISDTPDATFSEGFFVLPILFCGSLFTSVIYSDLQHPLERFQFMTLPCSQLERFLSKYIFTGPLFILYAVICVWIFKIIAPAYVTLFNGGAVSFDPLNEISVYAQLQLYLTLHAFFLIGAIIFKNFALVKTGVCLFILPFSFFMVVTIALKIIYFDHYIKFWSLERSEEILPGIQLQLFQYSSFVFSAWFLSYLWTLYIGYSCLRDHEA